MKDMAINIRMSLSDCCLVYYFVELPDVPEDEDEDDIKDDLGQNEGTCKGKLDKGC